MSVRTPSLRGRRVEAEQQEEQERREDHVVQRRLVDPHPGPQELAGGAREGGPGPRPLEDPTAVERGRADVGDAREPGRRAALVGEREEPAGRLAQVVADDQVADAPERDAERERDGAPSRIWKSRYPNRRNSGTLIKIAPAIPPSSVRPPFHSASMSAMPSNSEKWPIT